MFSIERQEKILELLKQSRSVTVSKLAKQLYIGEATIRRDLDALEKSGLVKRTYGGAVLVEGLSSEIPLLMRENESRESKLSICRQASELVSDGNIIIMDSSSTTYGMIEFIAPKKDLTVITNGAKTAVSLAESHNRVYSTGGELRNSSLSYIGQHAREFISGIHADLLFFSCRGLSDDGYLYDSSPEEAELRQIMIARAKKTVLLCDSTKVGKKSFYRICKISEVSLIISDLPLPREYEF